MPYHLVQMYTLGVLFYPDIFTTPIPIPQDNYLGLLQPLFTKCQPCKLHYRMVIQMDTMDRDAG